MGAYIHDLTCTWYIKFTYKDWMGEKHQKTKWGFRSRKDALTWEKEFCESVCNPAHFTGLAAKYVAACRIKNIAITVAKKINNIKKKMLPFFGTMLLNDITMDTIRQWHTYLMEDMEYYEKNINIIHAELMHIFNFAMKNDMMKLNPATLAKPAEERKKSKPNPMNYWTVEEFNQFLTGLSKPLPKMAYTMMFYTGMRLGEVLALTLKDCDFQKNTVNINKSISKAPGGTVHTARYGKENVHRIISLPQELMQVFKTYIQKFKIFDDDARVFPMKPMPLLRQLQLGIEKSKVKKIILADLRHSHVMMLIKMDVNPMTISSRLGYEDLKSVFRNYGHLYEENDYEVGKTLSVFFTGK